MSYFLFLLKNIILFMKIYFFPYILSKNNTIQKYYFRRKIILAKLFKSLFRFCIESLLLLAYCRHML